MDSSPPSPMEEEEAASAPPVEDEEREEEREQEREATAPPPAPQAWNRSLSKRVAGLATSIHSLVGDGLRPDIADNEHAQVVSRLREVFQIVTAAVRNGHAALGGIMTVECRSSLLAAGLVLHRTAPSSRRAREELLRTASLILVTIFSDVAVDDPSRVVEAQGRVKRWLDASWSDEDAREDVKNPRGTPADSGIASRAEVLTEETLRDLSLAYFVRVATKARGDILTASLQRAPPTMDMMSTIQLLEHEPTQGVVDAADAELGQQVRLSGLSGLSLASLTTHTHTARGQDVWRCCFMTPRVGVAPVSGLP